MNSCLPQYRYSWSHIEIFVEMCIYIVNIQTYFHALSAETSGSNGPLVAMSIPSAQILIP